MTFPTTGVLDDFNRADQTENLGSNWTVPLVNGQGSPGIISNTLYDASPNDSAYWNPITPGPDSEVYIDVSTKQTNNTSINLELRVVDPGLTTRDGYDIRMRASATTDAFQIRRIDNGTATALGADFSQEWSAGDSWGFEAIGSTLAAYYKTGGSWAQLGTRTDSTYSAAGRIGIITNDATWRGDNFGGGTVVAEGGQPAMLRTQGVPTGAGRRDRPGGWN